MPSFFAFVLPWYVGGFLLMAFWWRWWLLLPAGLIAVVAAKLEANSLATADGLGAALGTIMFVFLCIGAGTGFLSSALVIVGRWLRWGPLHPLFVLPVMAVLGFSGYFAFAWVNEQRHAQRMTPPSADCMGTVHRARLGDVDVRLPIAPGFFLESGDASEGHYLFDSNQSAREFCSDAESAPPELTSIWINLDGPPSRRPQRSQRSFCDNDKSRYPWGKMACELIPIGAIPDMPVRFKVVLGLFRPGVLKSLPSRTSGDLTIYTATNGQTFLERPDGYQARCYKPNSPQQPYLYCSVSRPLAEKLVLSYDFRTTEAAFLTQSAVVDSNARAIFQSLKSGPK